MSTNDIYLMCGKLVKDVEGVMCPCKREKGHKGGCNPFSNTPVFPQK